MGELLPRLSILTLAGGLFLLHFPGSRLRLTLSAILPYKARTFLTVIPFGVIPRNRSAELLTNYSTNFAFCQPSTKENHGQVVYLCPALVRSPSVTPLFFPVRHACTLSSFFIKKAVALSNSLSVSEFLFHFSSNLDKTDDYRAKH